MDNQRRLRHRPSNREPEQNISEDDDSEEDGDGRKEKEREKRRSPKDNVAVSPGWTDPARYPDLSEFKGEKDKPEIGFKKTVIGQPMLNQRVPHVETQTSNTESKAGPFCNLPQWCVVALVILAVVSSIGASFYIGKLNVVQEIDSSDDVKINWENVIMNFEDRFEHLKVRGSSQAKRTWNVLRASVRSVLKEYPPRPAVVVLVSQSGTAASVMDCLSEKFGTLVSSTFNHSYVKPRNIVVEGKHFSRDKASKRAVFDTIDDHLKNYNVVVVKDVDKLHGETAMAFHSFCDDGNAPYKHAVVILTLDCSSNPSGCSSEEDVEEYLTSVWEKELPGNKLYPLLSRITTNVAAMSVETKEVVKDLCSL